MVIFLNDTLFQNFENEDQTPSYKLMINDMYS